MQTLHKFSCGRVVRASPGEAVCGWLHPPGPAGPVSCPSSHSGRVHWLPAALMVPSELCQALCREPDTDYLAESSSQAHWAGAVIRCVGEPEALGGDLASQVYSHQLAKTPGPPPLPSQLWELRPEPASFLERDGADGCPRHLPLQRFLGDYGLQWVGEPRDHVESEDIANSEDDKEWMIAKKFWKPGRVGDSPHPLLQREFSHSSLLARSIQRPSHSCPCLHTQVPPDIPHLATDPGQAGKAAPPSLTQTCSHLLPLASPHTLLVHLPKTQRLKM